MRIPGTDIKNILSKYFDFDQLRKIERCFETQAQDEIYFDDKATQFARRYKNPKNRLRAIMLNTVKNEGTFIP